MIYFLISLDFFQLMYIFVYLKLCWSVNWSKESVWNKTWEAFTIIFLGAFKYLAFLTFSLLYCERLLYTLYTKSKYKCWKISSVTKTLQKMHLFFFRELRLITVLLLIHKSYTGWSTSFIHVKQWYFPFSIPPCFFLSLYFCSAKRRGSLTLKCYNSFQNKNNRKNTQFCS